MDSICLLPSSPIAVPFCTTAVRLLLPSAASSVKLLVAIAVKNDWELRRLDAKQAFIQADLDFNIFMKLPDGCGDKNGKVVKLNKSVYGLKQAGHRWAMNLSDVIVRK